jgi:hypothetical protein
MQIGSARLGVQRDAAASKACCRPLLQGGVCSPVRSVVARLLGQGFGLESYPIE